MPLLIWRGNNFTNTAMHVSFTGELKYWKCHPHCQYDWFGLSYVVDIFCLSLIPSCTPAYNLLLSKWMASVEYISKPLLPPLHSCLLFVFKILEVRRKKGSGIISKTCFLLDLLGHSVSFIRLVLPSFKVIYSPWSSLLLLTQHYSGLLLHLLWLLYSYSHMFL